MCVFISCAVAGQNQADSAKSDRPDSVADSLKQGNIVKADTSHEADTTQVDTTLKHSPRLAALLSTFIPGAGQVYNEKYWKVPVIYAGLITCAILFYKYKGERQNYKNAYYAMTAFSADTNSKTSINYKINKYLGNKTLASLYAYDSQWQADLVDGYNYYERYMYLNAFIFAGIYILNIVDATVDGYFYNYDITDKLSMRIEPQMYNLYRNNYGLKVTFRF